MLLLWKWVKKVKYIRVWKMKKKINILKIICIGCKDHNTFYMEDCEINEIDKDKKKYLLFYNCKKLQKGECSNCEK